MELYCLPNKCHICYSVFIFFPSIFRSPVSLPLLYTPLDSHTEKLMQDVCQQLNISEPPQSALTIDIMEEMLESNQFFAGISFENSLEMAGGLHYSLRLPSKFRHHAGYWPTDKLFDYYAFEGPRSRYNTKPNPDHINDKFYQSEGFLAIQHAIANAYAHKLEVDMPTIKIKAIPYPAHTTDGVLRAVQFVLPVVFMVSFGYIFVNTACQITLEKEKRLKKLMKLHGSYEFLHLLSWLVRCIIMQSITMIGVVVLCSVSNLCTFLVELSTFRLPNH